MKIAKLLPLALATVIVASPLRADVAVTASAPVAPETVATGAANEASGIPAATTPAPAAAEASRPLPDVRQGTPYVGSRKHMIGYSILFFVLSTIMATVLLRSKEDIPA